MSAAETSGHKRQSNAGAERVQPPRERVLDGLVLDALGAAEASGVEVDEARLARRMATSPLARVSLLEGIDERDAAASVARLEACGLVDRNGWGHVVLTALGRRHVRKPARRPSR